MNRPPDSNILKNLFMANGMSESQWSAIEKHIEDTREIHHSIIFFILDPFIGLKLIPQRWYDMFPPGFVDFVENVSNTIKEENRVAFFHRVMHFDINNSLYKILDRDVHIDDFLTYIPDCFLDIIMSNPAVLEKVIEQCKNNNQEDSIGYTKLLLLK